MTAGRESIDAMDLVKKSQGDDPANSRDRTQKIVATMSLFLDLFFDVFFQFRNERLVVLDELAVRPCRLAQRSRDLESLAEALSFRSLCDASRRSVEVVLAIQSLEMGQELCPFANEVTASTQ
jgi:hypothetical protein